MQVRKSPFDYAQGTVFRGVLKNHIYLALLLFLIIFHWKLEHEKMLVVI